MKGERFSRLLALQTRMTLGKHRSLVGSIQEVLVEGLSKKMDHQMTGRTACNKVVNFSDGAACVGQLVPVKIVEAFSHSLLGSPVKHSRQYSGHKGGILHAA